MLKREAGKSGAPPLLIVLSGPSGVGKDAVIDALKKRNKSLHFIVTATTRPMREGEKEGVDYHFFSEQTFKKMVHDDEFLEWAKVYEHYYGVLHSRVKEALSKGEDAIVRVDVQGAATIKSKVPGATFIFLAPSSLKELEKRLKQRASESSESLSLRLAKASYEMERLYLFDYQVKNKTGQLEKAVDEIESIVTAEKLRVTPKQVKI